MNLTFVTNLALLNSSTSFSCQFWFVEVLNLDQTRLRVGMQSSDLGQLFLMLSQHYHVFY